MRVALIPASGITLHTAVAAFPVPNDPAAGGDISPWRSPSIYAYDKAAIDITADKATTIDNLALYLVRDDGSIRFVRLLNGGATICLQQVSGGDPVVGFHQEVRDIGTAKRLIVGGYNGTSTPTFNAVVTVKIYPIQDEP